MQGNGSYHGFMYIVLCALMPGMENVNDRKDKGTL